MKLAPENLDAQESLAIIREMIGQAKGNAQRNAFYFLLWGWVVVIAQLGMFILDQLEYRYSFIIWLITLPAWAITIAKSLSNRERKGTVTLLDKISLNLWIAYGLVVITLIAFGFRINYQLNPLILLITAIPTFASGIILRFKPLLAGGVIFWISGIISFLLPTVYQPVMGAVAIASGYLVPGYMLKTHQELVNV